MATIASQITRISNSRNILRNKGVALQLSVPAGKYWDDATDTDVTTTSATLLKNTDQIDKIAAAFNAMPTKVDEEIRVPIEISTDGTVTLAQGTTLDTGFYSGVKIKPYVNVSTDVVLNVEEINRTLTSKSTTIRPSTGYNYISSFKYTVQTGAIQTSAVSFGNNYVKVKASKSGWIDTTDTSVNVTVTQSAMTTKVGTDSATDIVSGATINPDLLNNTVITVSEGIFGTARTITVAPVSLKTPGDAGENDILKDKIAWVDGIKVTGRMPNYGGTESAEYYEKAKPDTINYSGVLAIKPKLGYYNDNSTIYTDIVYNPTITFNTTSITTNSSIQMNAKTYYETIPAGYYPTDNKRVVTARAGVGTVKIDYEGNKATFDVTTSGWIASDVTANITAGAATYTQTTDDLEVASHLIVITPAKDANGKRTSYLTQVTVDNTVIYNLLAAI